MKKKSSLAFFIGWLVIGVLMLLTEVNKLTYACMWILLLFKYLEEAVCGDYEAGYKDGLRDAYNKCKQIVNEVFESGKGEHSNENLM